MNDLGAAAMARFVTYRRPAHTRPGPPSAASDFGERTFISECSSASMMIESPILISAWPSLPRGRASS